MTIVAGFHFEHGLLVWADTQISSDSQSHGDKLHYFSVLQDQIEIKMVTAITGSVALARMAVHKCEEAVSKLSKDQRNISNVREALEDALLEFHKKHIFEHPSYGKADGPSVQLLFAVWMRYFPHLSIVFSDETAIQEAPSYVCLGSGGDIADYLAASIHQKNDYHLNEITLIATYILRHAKNYDLYCGGDSNFVVIRSDGSWSPIGMFSISSAEAYSKTFDDVMKQLCFSLADLNLDDSAVVGSLDLSKELLLKIRGEQRIKKQQLEELIKTLSANEADKNRR